MLQTSGPQPMLQASGPQPMLQTSGPQPMLCCRHQAHSPCCRHQAHSPCCRHQAHSPCCRHQAHSPCCRPGPQPMLQARPTAMLQTSWPTAHAADIQHCSEGHGSAACYQLVICGATQLISNCLLPQTHPNVDKQQFNQNHIIAMKQEGRSFPLNQDVGVLKWRFQTTDESLMPLSSKCNWPPFEGNGKMYVGCICS